MDKDICLHAIYAKSDFYNSTNTIAVLEEILKRKAVLPKSMLEEHPESKGFNGIDYISLCDYSKKDYFYINKFNSFEGYIRFSLSLVFPKEKLSIITPELIDVKPREKYYKLISEYGLSKDKRYSDMPDEVQVKGPISLDLMTGITLPVDKMIIPYASKKSNIKHILREIEIILLTLKRYNYNVPIYDIDTTLSLMNEANVKRLVNIK